MCQQTCDFIYFIFFSRKKNILSTTKTRPFGASSVYHHGTKRHRPRCPRASPCGFWWMESPVARREPRKCTDQEVWWHEKTWHCWHGTGWDMMGFYGFFGCTMGDGDFTIVSLVTHGDLWSSWIKNSREYAQNMWKDLLLFMVFMVV